jgi:hypothetical protein
MSAMPGQRAAPKITNASSPLALLLGQVFEIGMPMVRLSRDDGGNKGHWDTNGRPACPPVCVHGSPGKPLRDAS